MTQPIEPSGPYQSWAERVAGWRRLVPWPSAQVAMAAVVAAVAIVVGVVLFTRQSAPPPALALPQAGPGASAPSTAAGDADPVGGSAKTITVHAAGAVTRPGVYAVAAGARVADVVAAAGGPSADADLDRLNLAAKASDGERIYVPRHGEAAPAPVDGGPDAGGGTGGPAAPLDLNTATVAQLDTLPGVGPALAQAIVNWRTKHGPFRSVTALLDVPGIGPAKLDSIRPLVRV